MRRVLLLQGYFSRPRSNSFMSDQWSSIPQPRKDLYLKDTPDPSYPWREDKVFQAESYCLTCLTFSNKTDSPVLWLNNGVKSFNVDWGGSTSVTCFTHKRFFYYPDLQLIYISEAVFPVIVICGRQQTAVPQTTNCSLYWQVLFLCLLQCSGSSMAHAAYILE